MQDCCFCAIGWSKVCTNEDIRSVGTTQPDIKKPAKGTEGEQPAKEKTGQQPVNNQLTARSKEKKQDTERKKEKTENCIKLPEEQLTKRTCPKDLRYTAKPNISPDNIFQKEIQEVKLEAEQRLVDSLTRFLKRKLEGQKKKLRANSENRTRRKYVNRQPLYTTHSANHIVNYNNVKLADLQKQFSDPEIVCSIKTTNKQDERCNSVFSDSSEAGHNTSRGISKTDKRHKNRRNASEKRQTAKERELNEKFLKNLYNHQLTDTQPVPGSQIRLFTFTTIQDCWNRLTDTQVNVLSRGLKFIPRAVTNKTNIRRQLLRDFDLLARRMRLQYIFHGQNKEPHPFHVKSNWMPPVQQSVALESSLESVKTQLSS